LILFDNFSKKSNTTKQHQNTRTRADSLSLCELVPLNTNKLTLIHSAL